MNAKQVVARVLMFLYLPCIGIPLCFLGAFLGDYWVAQPLVFALSVWIGWRAMAVWEALYNWSERRSLP